ncbi:FxLYD domain-containing protein [Paenibacillus bovis]|uniref:Zinc-ribbon domain-containing protein n=1 Tax=Paenibacillus bovis TaxID=1616788 RepID=A0A172ZLZ5_9BACL|nr:FxLYD domain-containing protein [Paenibacillus bovis]ANF98150.1 hypothetical protein AR543_20480 [Paenibacillus bovis]
MIHCHVCGAPQQEDAVFCSRCGIRLTEDTEPDQADATQAAPDALELLQQNILPNQPAEPVAALPAEPVAALLEDTPTAANTESLLPSRHHPRHPMMWITPVLLLLITGAALWWAYQHELQQNQQAIQLQQQAQKLALQSKYKEAENTINQALALRPQEPSFTTDLNLIQKADRLHTKLTAVSGRLKNNQLDSAEHSLGILEKELSGRTEPLFRPEQKLAEQNRNQLSILTIKKELDNLNDVESLAYKLDEVDRLDTKDAQEVHDLIINKIVLLTLKQAEELIQDSSFDEAAQIVQTAIEYTGSQQKLKDMQTRIRSEQQAFEKAEQERIRAAQQMAEAEDLKNRTEGVQVSQVTTSVTEYGDLDTTGIVENTATQPIYGITIHYSLYDANGAYLSSSTTSTDPYYLEPGETASFSAYDYGYGWYDQVQVQLDQVTWYLDEGGSHE